MQVNNKKYGGEYISFNFLDLLRQAAAENPDRVEKLSVDIWALDDDNNNKWLFVASNEAHKRLVADLGWEDAEPDWYGGYREPQIGEDETYWRQDTYQEYWNQLLTCCWDGVHPYDLEIACVDPWRPVYTIDGIVRDEDGAEEYHRTCWGTISAVLRPEAKYWTYDNFQIEEEIVALAENGYIRYDVFDLLPESED